MAALITPDDVQNAPEKERPKLFADYVQQTLGTPWPTMKDMIVLRKKINEIFEHHPNANYHTLCRIVIFSRSRKRRFERVWGVLGDFRWAFKAGVLTELDPTYQTDGHYAPLVQRALEDEKDPVWRKRLLMAGAQQQESVYLEWRKHKNFAGAA